MDTQQIQTTIENFTYGAAEQDVDRISSAFHAQSQMHYLGGEGLVTIPIAQYLEMTRDGKVGGTPYTLAIHSIEVSDTIARVKATRQSDQTTFHDYLTLMKIDGTWQILSDVMHVAQACDRI